MNYEPLNFANFGLSSCLMFNIELAGAFQLSRTCAISRPSAQARSWLAATITLVLPCGPRGTGGLPKILLYEAMHRQETHTKHAAVCEASATNFPVGRSPYHLAA